MSWSTGLEILVIMKLGEARVDGGVLSLLSDLRSLG